MKSDGVGEENPDTCFSPLETASLDLEHRETEEPSDIVFAPARILNFDDSDGDDLSSVDHRLVVFSKLSIQSPF